jgi:hypothetical protein
MKASKHVDCTQMSEDRISYEIYYNYSDLFFAKLRCTISISDAKLSTWPLVLKSATKGHLFVFIFNKYNV